MHLSSVDWFRGSKGFRKTTWLQYIRDFGLAEATNTVDYCGDNIQRKLETKLSKCPPYRIPVPAKLTLFPILPHQKPHFPARSKTNKPPEVLLPPDDGSLASVDPPAGDRPPQKTPVGVGEVSIVQRRQMDADGVWPCLANS